MIVLVVVVMAVVVVAGVVLCLVDVSTELTVVVALVAGVVLGRSTST